MSLQRNLDANAKPNEQHNCPFYNRNLLLLIPARIDEATQFQLVRLGESNRCAAITTAHSPCRMEIAGLVPDWRTCPVLRDAVFVGE